MVDVQQLPWFFLQPENVNSYIGDENDAILKCNATGWPYPGFKWFFRCLDCERYTQIPNEDENELVISNPQLHHEGSYFTEAVNEQGSTRSKIVYLMALDVTVTQLSQSFSINLTSISLNMQENLYEFKSRNDIKHAKDQFNKTLFRVINFLFNSIENISISTTSSNTLSFSFTLYSRKLSYYYATSQDSLTQHSLQACVDWIQIVEKLNELLTTTSIRLSIEDTVYESNPNSTITSLPQYSCPPGKKVSSTNSFVCGKWFV